MAELEEARAYLDYVHNHCLTAVQPVIRMVLCRRFVQETNSDTDPRDLYQRARRISPPVELKDMDPVSRARVHFTLSIPVKQADFGFLDRLRENAEVDLDTEQRIIKFWSNDGSVKLQGSHKRKDKDGYVANASRRSKRGARDDSDDEGDDADPDYPAQKRPRGGAVRGLIPTGMGAGTSSFVGLSPAAQGGPSTSVGASLLGAQNTAPVGHPDQDVRVPPMTQGAPNGAPPTGTESVEAQNAALAICSEPPTAEGVAGLNTSTLPPTQLIPTGMGAGTSSFVHLSLAAQGEQSTSGAPMLGAHTPVAHLDQGAPNRAPPAETVSVGAQNAAQGAASDQEVTRRTESPVATNDGQHSGSGGQPAKALGARGSSSIQEATQGGPGDSTPTGDGAPNSEPGESVVLPASGIERASSNICAPQTQQAASGAQNCGPEMARHGILAPVTQLVRRHAWLEQAEGAPSWNIGSQQAQSYAQSSYEAWWLQQSRMAGGFGNGALMAQNFSAPVAPGTPSSWLRAPDEPKPVLGEDVSPEEQKKFQTQLLNAIDGQNLPLGERLVEKIRKAVPEKTIKVSAFTIAVEACINILSKTERVEEGPGLKTLLILLENAVVSMRAPALASLRMAIQKLYKETPEEKMFDVETLNLAIMTMVKLIY